MTKIVAYFDGANEPTNPGGTPSYGIVVFDGDKEIYRDGKVIRMTGQTSNNISEYVAFGTLLRWLLKEGYQDREIVIRGDSQLVINQMLGLWKMKGGLYFPYAEKAEKLMAKFSHLTLEWIPREENEIANTLSMRALIRAGVTITDRSKWKKEMI